MLLDDELTALSYTKMLCEQIDGVEVVKAFNNPLMLLDAANNLDYNTCILDVQMPGMTGLDLAKSLKDKLIIFTTAYKEFAAEAFDLNAVDYIRKPLQKERFEKAIAKAQRALENKQKTPVQVLWATDQGKSLFNSDDILYIISSEIDSRDKLIFLRNGKKSILKNINFSQIVSALPASGFSRINKKAVINHSIVQGFSGDRLQTLADDQMTFTLSDSFRENFRLKFTHSTDPRRDPEKR